MSGASRSRFIFFDIETTGLSKRSDRITEVALWEPITKVSYTTLINPERKIPLIVQNINGINDEM